MCGSRTVSRRKTGGKSKTVPVSGMEDGEQRGGERRDGSSRKARWRRVSGRRVSRRRVSCRMMSSMTDGV